MRLSSSRVQLALGVDMSPKLTDEQVRELRWLKLVGWSNKELAYKFGIAAASVSRILNRRRRRSVI